MPQLHMYVSEDVAERIRARAKARNLSVSRYLAQLVTNDMDQGWPEDFFETVIGGWQGTPLERPPQGELESRDTLM